MHPETSALSQREERFGEIVFAYLQAREHGQPIQPELWLSRYPEFAAELTAFFASREDVDRLAAPLRALVQSAITDDSDPAMSDMTVTDNDADPVAVRPRCYGDYQIIERLADGGMGVVYKARQKSLHRLVALKVIRAGELASPAEIQRFRQEAETVALLDHPHIVPVYEVGEQHGRLYFSMKLIEGGSLAQQIGVTGQGSGVSKEEQRRAARLLQTVARAIHYAHQRGVLHRDLKPSNILLDRDGQPHITDFGLAKRLATDTGLTQTDALIGTPSYMSPEQATNQKAQVTTATDVYGLGTILYALLTGHPPFRGEDVLQTLEQVKLREPDEPRRSNPTIDRDLQTICLKCLRKEPVQRYTSADELADDLERWLRGEPIRARSLTWTARCWRWCRRNPAWAAMLALVVHLAIVMVVGATLLLMRALTAEAHTRERLFESRLAEATALSLSQRPGQHFASLARLHEAAELAGSLRLPTDRLLDLRNAAITALTRPDLYPESTWPGFPAGSHQVDFDGQLEIYARTDRKGDCRVCRAGTGEEVAFLPGPRHVDPAMAASWPCLSRDGRFVAVCHDDGQLRLWRLGHSGPQLVLTERRVRWIDFRPDSRQVAFAHTNGSISVFDLSTLQCLGRLAADHLTQEILVALHPREPLVAVVSPHVPVVQVRDVRTGNVLATLRLPTLAFHAGWHPLGHALAVLAEGGTVHVFDRATFHEQTAWSAFGVFLTFSPDGNLVATRDYRSTVGLYDFVSGQRLLSCPVSTPTMFLRFDASGRRLAGFRNDNRLGIWQLSTGRAHRTLTQDTTIAPGPWTMDVAVHPDGRLLAATSAEGVGLWDLEDGRRFGFLRLAMPGAVAFTGESEPALVTVSEHGGTFRWPVRWDARVSGLCHIGPPEPLALPPGSVGMFAQSADSQVLATSARAAGTTLAWAGIWNRSRSAEQPLRHLEVGVDQGSPAVSPDGRWLVSTPWGGGRANLYDARTGRLKARLAKAGSHPRFSPDGRWLAVAGGALFRVGTWEIVRPLPYSCLFSPDGLTAVEGTADPHVLRLVEVMTGRELARLEEPSLRRNTAFCFTPDGTRLITGNAASAIHIWDLRLLRAQLAARGLDWDMPAYKAATPTRQPLQVQVDRGDYEHLSRVQILKAYDLGIAAAPKVAVRWYLRGRFRWAAGQQKEAARDLRQAVALAPDTADFANDLAWCYLTGPDRSRHATEAVALAEKAVKNAPGRWEYVNTLGMAYYTAGRFHDAMAALEKSLRGGAGDSDAYDLYGLAMCHAKLGETDKARACLARGLVWQKSRPNATAQQIEELRALRAEAEKILAPTASLPAEGHNHGPAPPTRKK